MEGMCHKKLVGKVEDIKRFIMRSWKNSIWFQILLLVLGGLISAYVNTLWMYLALLGVPCVGLVVTICCWRMKRKILSIESCQGQPKKGKSFFRGLFCISTISSLSKIFKMYKGDFENKVLVTGPFGNPTVGNSFDYIGYDSIKMLIIRSGSIVDSIEAVFRKDGRDVSQKAGGDGGNYKEFTLEDGEYITEVKGSYGTCNNYSVIISIAFSTNRGKLGKFGEPNNECILESTRFHIKSGKIVGFFGTTTTEYITSIGFYCQ